MLNIIILAAGKGTRMKSERAKVLFEAADKPMVDYVIEMSLKLEPSKIIVVVGNSAQSVQSHIETTFGTDKIEFALQKEQKGTADAVKSALNQIKQKDGKVLILCGDMPLVPFEIIEEFIKSAKSKINFISAETDSPKGYGRVVRGSSGAVMKIIEEKDANPSEKKIKEINTGVYLADLAELKQRIDKIDNKNAQNEFYLTDIVKDGADAHMAPNFIEFSGVNDRVQLEEVSRFIYKARAKNFMREGVTIIDSNSFYAGDKVLIGKDTIIYPNVFLEGNVKIGSGCKIYSGVRIVNSQVDENCVIKDNSLIEDAFVGKSSSVGPMAHLRPGSVLEGNNKIGNFVELKKTTMGENSQASHLTYLGDATLGRNVNIGCGTITCNYDGFNKYETKIGDNVFVGSDSHFVAPISVGDNALIAAGATITKDVPSGALALARTEQVNKEGAAIKIMARNKAKKELKTK